jgi:3-oxoacyl-[acyl-carrier protein] reductase
MVHKIKDKKMLKNKTAVVTGATRGIGRAIALELAQGGANIAFNYIKNEGMALELENEIMALHRKVFSRKADVGDFSEVSSFVEQTNEILGPIDILVNNSGITRDQAIVMMNKKDWDSVIRTNLTSVFNTCKCVVFDMMKRRCGHIINISSVSGMLGLSRQTNYSASKAGMIGFTKALAKEVGEYGIRVNAVAPGYIETEMVQTINGSLKSNIVDNLIPMKRFGVCSEVSSLVRFLLEGGDSYMTGCVIPVDGGRHNS